MPVSLDDLDRAILNMLQDDSRMAYTAIGKELGISEGTVRYRVKNLVEQGVILNFTTLLDPRKVGFPITGILTAHIAAGSFDSVVDELKKIDEIHHMFQSTGKFDLVIVANTEDMGHLGELKNEIETIEGISDVELFANTNLVMVEPKINL